MKGFFVYRKDIAYSVRYLDSRSLPRRTGLMPDNLLRKMNGCARSFHKILANMARLLQNRNIYDTSSSSIYDKMGQEESEKLLIKRIFNAEIEKKSPTAWASLKKIGKSIGKAWKAKQQSWEIISISRR